MDGEEGREGMGVGALSKLGLTFVPTSINFLAVQQSWLLRVGELISQIE